MADQFVVINVEGEEIDHIDPYEAHTEISPGTFLVDNGFDRYQTVVPTGGRFEIRTIADSATTEEKN